MDSSLERHLRQHLFILERGAGGTSISTPFQDYLPIANEPGGVNRVFESLPFQVRVRRAHAFNESLEIANLGRETFDLGTSYRY
ncbi:MAG TPA: hypothetical protein VL523_01175 [Terriglobia bacterium]|nr:hypothetical protein [Terriglobia bacterium]